MPRLPQAELKVKVESSQENPASVEIRVQAQHVPNPASPSRLFRSANAKIGANCLSIIGHIEPGRTVRLYRQIH